MRPLYFLILLIFSAPLPLLGQENFPRNDISDERSGFYAFTKATIFISPNQSIKNATLIIQKGKVVQVGNNIAIPKGATVVDLSGKFIYPSFIDVYSHYGMPKIKSKPSDFWSSPEKMTPNRKGAYNANDAIKADFAPAAHFAIDQKQAKMMRNIGFGTILTFRPDGLARGFASAVSLRNENENKAILKAQAGAALAFDRGSSQQDYPISMMGFVAVLRQTYYDEEWYYTQGKNDFYDHTLEAFHTQRTLPNIFEANDNSDVMRIHTLSKEFQIPYIIKGSGKEYQRINDIAGYKHKLVLPLNFPSTPDVSDVFAARDISLGRLKHWELAPSNPARVAEKGIEFAFTAYGLKGKKTFLKNLRMTVEHGLASNQALAALTTNPAKMLKMDNMLGTLEKGKLANFFVASGDIFDKKTKIYQNWVQGLPFVTSSHTENNYSGNYSLSLSNDASYQLNITEEGKYKMSVAKDTTKMKTKGMIDNLSITINFVEDKKHIRLSGWAKDKGFSGVGELADGTQVTWSATYQKEAEKKKIDKKKEDKKMPMGKVIYPFVAYGMEGVPQMQTVLFKNATVWTNEAQGILQNTDVLVKGGKIATVGKDLSAQGAKVIDATGKHLTAGIIDEHSHIALRNVNDISTISAQVRMSDVVDSEDIDIYRQLAGGVTTSQLLHGSANPVGGQSAIVKMRWGKNAEDMLVKKAAPFIKFALGENVKRSYNNNSRRYPQTRMGVEQLYVDAFTRAKEYDMRWKAYQKDRKKNRNAKAPRRDIQLETLAQILNKERFITCHSYVQSEINMLMKVAKQFDFRINTFTHILEGYKVADKMKAHGVGGSTFSDWWAYKYEVHEAIPYNAAIMAKVGVTTAINSDDAEMGRRLNQEAAKAVKYGGLTEEEALKLVTLNPAKLLHLDDRMGSIQKGKDADVVLWSDNPLSIYAKAEKTLIDGVIYFDREEDTKKREYIQKERARLIQKAAMKGGKRKGKSKAMKGKQHLKKHCDTIILE